MSILVIMEPIVAEENARDKLARLVQGAGPLGDIAVLVAGSAESGVRAALERVINLAGVSRWIVVEHDALAGLPVENLAALVQEMAPDFTHIVVAVSSFGSALLPRIAALLHTGMVTGVRDIVDSHTFVRPVQAGDALETVQVMGRPVCVSLRVAGFSPVGSVAKPMAPVKTCHPETALDLGLSRLLERRPSETKGRPDLGSARRVVVGGGGVVPSGTFALIETLADALGAAVGATRAAVDAELAPTDWQIGQTGRIIAPDLYIGVGVSGSLQHMAGIKEAKTVLAINHDPSAPLMAVADFSLEADLYQAVPVLIDLLKNP